MSTSTFSGVRGFEARAVPRRARRAADFIFGLGWGGEEEGMGWDGLYVHESTCPSRHRRFRHVRGRRSVLQRV